MTFGSMESSRALGAPVSLYKFMYQTIVFGYTSAEQSVDFDGVSYLPVAVDRDAINTTGTLDKAALVISLPFDTDIATLFRVYPPSDVVSVIVYDGHPDEGVDYTSVWSGRVIGCSDAQTTAQLSCELISTSMRRPALRRRWQRGCPLVLYGIGPGQCNADKTAATVAATVTSLSGASLVLASGWNGAFPADQYPGGYIEFAGTSTTEKRGIIAADPSGAVVIESAIKGLLPGSTISVVRGCDHLQTGCNTHSKVGGGSNINNYGGDDYIPLKNPIGTTNIYY